MQIEEKINIFEKFKENLKYWRIPSFRSVDIRAYINQNKAWIRQEIIEAGCFVTLKLRSSPQDIDPFSLLLNSEYIISVVPIIIDMLDTTIGVLRYSPADESKLNKEVIMGVRLIKNYAFVAMAIDSQNAELEDVLDAIKEGSMRCGIQAERVDEPQSNDRITDRILESLRKAEYVIVDLTYSRPNVYYEAGFAHGIGKIPIYIAKEGTKLEFDLKDYPVIFYRSMKQLKDLLESRLRGLAEKVN